MSKESFIATGVLLALIIDLVRIPVYWISYARVWAPWTELLPLVFFTFLGTLAGKALLGHFSISQFRKTAAVLIVLIGIYFLIRID